MKVVFTVLIAKYRQADGCEKDSLIKTLTIKINSLKNQGVLSLKIGVKS